MENYIVVFWFRRDLRLNDNHGLYKALKSGLPVLPIFIYDKNIIDGLPANDKRVQFISNALNKIRNKFKFHNKDMAIYYDIPENVFQNITNDYKIRAVYTNHDYEPDAIKRDQRIKENLTAKNIAFHSFKDQAIFEKDEILTAAGKPYNVFTPYARQWRSKISAKIIAPYPSETLIEKITKPDLSEMPKLETFHLEQNKTLTDSPEIDDDLIKSYDKTRNNPSINTTRLGVHLRFGTISIRHLVQKALDLNETWLSELIWRDFFMMILFNYPHVVEKPFREKYAVIPWLEDREAFQKWCEGKTGYPMVDAGMRELNETGFMHNRVRMVTASFLCKHLLINWQKGEEYFALKLLDFELSSNNGNWQWAAGCGCDAAPYFRVFNPITQQQKFDGDFIYIKKWIPEFGTSKYPEPIIEHKFARERAIDVYKKALA